MDEWVTTKEAFLIKKVGLSPHRIAELAKKGEIIGKKVVKGKWLIKVVLNNNKYELVKIPPKVASKNKIKLEQQSDEIALLEKEKLERKVKQLRIDQYTMDTGKLI